MRARDRASLHRRLDRLEGRLPDPRRCVCQVGSGGTQSVLFDTPGRPEGERCPACGRERIVVKLAFDPFRTGRES
jgi:hypothetical protein